MGWHTEFLNIWWISYEILQNYRVLLATSRLCDFKIVVDYPSITAMESGSSWGTKYLRSPKMVLTGSIILVRCYILVESETYIVWLRLWNSLIHKWSLRDSCLLLFLGRLFQLLKILIIILVEPTHVINLNTSLVRCLHILCEIVLEKVIVVWVLGCGISRVTIISARCIIVSLISFLIKLFHDILLLKTIICKIISSCIICMIILILLEIILWIKVLVHLIWTYLINSSFNILSH